RGVRRREPGRRPRLVPGHRVAGRAGREVQAVLPRLPVCIRSGRIPEHERETEPSMTIEPAAATSDSATATSDLATATSESATATSPYLSLRRAVRPAILAH